MFIPILGGGTVPVDVNFRATAVSTSNLATYTFTSQALGPASPSRRILVAAKYLTGGSAVAVNSVTVGGVTCTLPAGLSVSATTAGIRMGIAKVPTGTTGNVVVTLAASVNNCGIGVWSLDNLLSPTPFDTSAVSANASTLPFMSLDTNAGGAAVYASIATNNTRTFSWSNPTENYDAAIEGVTTHSGASMATTGNSINETLTLSGAAVVYGVAASFR
tara:strand:- start:121 stop:774 length:654 start_codon:yes stop_codon:yes gene_type:complete